MASSLSGYFTSVASAVAALGFPNTVTNYDGSMKSWILLPTALFTNDQSFDNNKSFQLVVDGNNKIAYFNISDYLVPLVSAQGQGGDSFGNTVKTFSEYANYLGFFIDAAEQTIQTTRVGSNFAYAISGSSKLVNVVSNTIKYAPYVGLFVTVGTGSYLSTENNPATGSPYQSWAETGTDVGVNIATIYIGTQCGGWYGAGAAAFYIGVKTNVQYQMNNGLNPGMIFIMNKE